MTTKTIVKEKVNTGYLSLKETMKYLGINKPELERLVRNHRITAFRLGGSHLRFRKDQLLILKHELENMKPSAPSEGKNRFLQFWIFNGFYIVTGAILSGLLFFLLKT